MDKTTLRQLCETYDRGRLVPFIGAGMSIPAAVNWKEFVGGLLCEAKMRDALDDSTPEQLMELADRAMLRLRCTADATGLRRHIKRALYCHRPCIPEQTDALAQLVWPLICTTNYDDVYLRAKKEVLRRLPNPPPLPQMFGRSDEDCRRVLEQVRFPVGEAIWALQGILRPRSDIREGVDRPARLESEIVVGHAEYRSVTHREPWFRRAFAEVFRSSSLLFLGSGLADPYFLALFDEIVDLTGPPTRPHFAVVPKATDESLLRRRYHIICITYCDPGEVTAFLSSLVGEVKGLRVRKRAWPFNVAAKHPPSRKPSYGKEDFAIVHAPLPLQQTKQKGHCQRRTEDRPKCSDDPCRKHAEVVAVSCGGTPDKPSLNPSLEFSPRCQQRASDFLVRFDDGRVYGIVAREPGAGDVRTPRMVREAFRNALGKL